MNVQQPSQMLPAYEQLKIYVVSNLFDISETFGEFQRNFYHRKYPLSTAAIFKSQIQKFYRFIRPHILNYQKELSSEADIEIYKSVVSYMDYYKDNPRKLTDAEAMAMFDFLLQFCQDAGLTKLTVQRI